MSFPNNYVMSRDGAITEFDDPNLLSNRRVTCCTLVLYRDISDIRFWKRFHMTRTRGIFNVDWGGVNIIEILRGARWFYIHHKVPGKRETADEVSVVYQHGHFPAV